MATVRTRRRGKAWSYSFEAGRNPATGRRKMCEKGGYESREAAYDAGIIAYAKYKHGGLDTTQGKTLYRDYFTFWLTKVIKPTVKPATYESYQKTYKNHLQQFTAFET